MKEKILVVRKMSALEYYYQGNHKNQEIHDSHKTNNESVNLIDKILSQSNVEYKIVTRDELSKDFVNQYDKIISAGGDGTVIAVAAYNQDKPQLNLMTDFRSVGALCQKNIKKSLDALLNNNYSIENWQREDVFLDKKYVATASNEVCVGEQLRIDKMSKYKLTFFDEDKQKLENEIHCGSGIVIVTGTGSTAWPSLFEKYSRTNSYLKFKTLLPYKGDIPYGKTKNLVIEYLGYEGKFSLDTKDYEFPRDSILEIKLSKYPLKVIIPN